MKHYTTAALQAMTTDELLTLRAALSRDFARRQQERDCTRNILISMSMILAGSSCYLIAGLQAGCYLAGAGGVLFTGTILLAVHYGLVDDTDTPERPSAAERRRPGDA